MTVHRLPYRDGGSALGLDQLVDALAERVARKVAETLTPLLAARTDGELLTIAEAAV